jgi:hypothetical protein
VIDAPLSAAPGSPTVALPAETVHRLAVALGRLVELLEPPAASQPTENIMEGPHQ